MRKTLDNIDGFQVSVKMQRSAQALSRALWGSCSERVDLIEVAYLRSFNWARW